MSYFENKVSAPRHIVGVAIIFNGIQYALDAPNRHHHVIRMISEKHGGMYGNHKEGFVDNTGAFLSRQMAFDLASVNGQLIRIPGGYNGPDLYSEDLW